MCIAILKPKGITLSRKRLENSFNSNPDGAGFAVARKGKVEIHKGYFKFEDFMKAFEPFQKYPAIVHFRLATHGNTDKDNCHPFAVSEDIAMIHNGIISEFCTSGKKSDTWLFTDSIASPFYEEDGPDFLDDIENFKLIEEFIGPGNKLVFLRGDGATWIINESAGHWYKGAWWSNRSYQYATRWVTTTTPSRKYYPMSTGTFKRTQREKWYDKRTGAEGSGALYSWDWEEEDKSQLEELEAHEVLEEYEWDYCDCCLQSFEEPDLIQCGVDTWLCLDCLEDCELTKSDAETLTSVTTKRAEQAKKFNDETLEEAFAREVVN